MDGRGAQSPGTASDGSLRLVWRLFSPSFRQVSCAVTRSDERFTLTVQAEDQVLTACEGAELADLHAKAAEWRTLLEARGYVPVTAVRVSEPRPALERRGEALERRGEARTAFIGLIECAALLELQHAAAARQIRDRATEGLVAVGLRNPGLMSEAIQNARRAVSGIAPAESEKALLSSCLALLDRAQATLPGERSDPVS